jgi:hypothetical protein
MDFINTVHFALFIIRTLWCVIWKVPLVLNNKINGNRDFCLTGMLVLWVPFVEFIVRESSRPSLEVPQTERDLSLSLSFASRVEPRLLK